MKLALLIVSVLSVSSAFGLPKAPFNALEVDAPAVLKALEAQRSLNKDSKEVDPGDEVNLYDFEGIVKLSNCSGAVIHFSGQPLNSEAYVLTNGHCLQGGFLKPGEARFNVDKVRSMRVSTKQKEFKPVTATKLVYGTMTGTDAAIYQLKETYEDLESLGIRAFEFDSTRPLIGFSIDIVSGFWERGFRCEIDKFVFQLKEGDWTFTDSVRYSETGCETFGGTSGSPIIHTDTRTVVAINNTRNESGGECTINNPCEVDDNGVQSIHEGRSYGQQTYNFYNCLSVDFKIDLNKDGCDLTRPQS